MREKESESKRLQYIKYKEDVLKIVGRDEIYNLRGK